MGWSCRTVFNQVLLELSQLLLEAPTPTFNLRAMAEPCLLTFTLTKHPNPMRLH